MLDQLKTKLFIYEEARKIQSDALRKLQTLDLDSNVVLQDLEQQVGDEILRLRTRIRQTKSLIYKVSKAEGHFNADDNTSEASATTGDESQG